MHAGLLRILDLIRADPKDTLLIDRFLILAADLQEDEKIKATLGLSEVLIAKNPRRAIELAHMVYSAVPGEIQSLELMIDGLEILGRFGKATVLREHLLKVRNAIETNPGLVKSLVGEGVEAIDRELSLLGGAQIQTPPKPKIVEAAAPVVPPSVASNPENFMLPGIPLKPDRLSESDVFKISPLPRLELPDEAELEVQIQSEIPYEQPALDLDDKLTKGRTHITQNSHGRDISADLLRDGTPSMELINEIKLEAPEEQSVSQGGESLHGVPSVMFPDGPESNTYESPVQTTEINDFGSSKVAQQSLEEIFSRCLQMKMWDDAWAIIEANWPRGTTEGVYEIARMADLYKVDVKFHGWWIDCLNADSRPRQAVFLILQTLKESPYIGYARSLYPKIQASLINLGLGELTWDEAEGVAALILKTKLKVQSTSAAVAIFEARGVA
jgi:hypothetical protein